MIIYCNDKCSSDEEQLINQQFSGLMGRIEISKVEPNKKLPRYHAYHYNPNLKRVIIGDGIDQFLLEIQKYCLAY